jgi:hypothetical protein
LIVSKLEDFYAKFWIVGRFIVSLGAEESSQEIKYNYSHSDDYLHTGVHARLTLKTYRHCNIDCYRFTLYACG